MVPGYRMNYQNLINTFVYCVILLLFFCVCMAYDDDGRIALDSVEIGRVITKQINSYVTSLRLHIQVQYRHTHFFDKQNVIQNYFNPLPCHVLLPLHLQNRTALLLCQRLLERGRTCVMC